MSPREMLDQVAIIRVVCDEMRNGSIAPRDAWRALESAALALHDHAINAAINAVKEGAR